MAGPWEKYAAQPQGPWSKYGQDAAPAPPETPPTLGQRAEQFVQQTALPAAENFISGIGAGALHTLYDIGAPAGWLAQKMGGTENEATKQALFSTPTTAGKIGRGIEQATEFMAPGPAEEEIAARAPAALKPLVRLGTSALGAGAVNKAQGGSFKTGAAGGAIGSGVGQLAEKAAVPLMETALRVGKRERAFGKAAGSIGKAALEETRGVRPETIERTGREAIANLEPQLTDIVRAASERPNPARGLLMPPPREIPLGRFEPDVRGELIPAARLPQENITGMGTDLSVTGPGGRIRGVPGRQVEQLGSTAGTVPPRLMRESYVTSGVREPQDLPRSGPGVLLRRGNLSEGAIPPLPVQSVSMSPARAAVSGPMGEAAGNEAAGLHQQLADMADFLQRGRVSGEPIPESITPARALQLKRGFSDEYLGKWNPDVHAKTTAAGRQAYRALAEGIHQAAPGSRELDWRISNLIPVVRRAESVGREAPMLERIGGRFARPTGALTGMGLGGYAGYRETGTPEGAILGGLTGLVAPEVLSSPEGQAALARMFYGAGNLRPLVGAALQTEKKK